MDIFALVELNDVEQLKWVANGVVRMIGIPLRSDIYFVHCLKKKTVCKSLVQNDDAKVNDAQFFMSITFLHVQIQLAPKLLV